MRVWFPFGFKSPQQSVTSIVRLASMVRFTSTVRAQLASLVWLSSVVCRSSGSARLSLASFRRWSRPFLHPFIIFRLSKSLIITFRANLFKSCSLSCSFIKDIQYFIFEYTQLLFLKNNYFWKFLVVFHTL